MANLLLLCQASLCVAALHGIVQYIAELDMVCQFLVRRRET